MSIKEIARTLTGETTYEITCARCGTASRNLTLSEEMTSYEVDAIVEALAWEHWRLIRTDYDAGRLADVVILCPTCPACDETGHTWVPVILEGAEVLQCALCWWTPHVPLPAGAATPLPPAATPKRKRRRDGWP